MSEITIQGRRYTQIVNGTFAHDMWLMSKIRESGLSNIKINEGESQDEFIERIAAVAFESGGALDLLGGTCLPEGVESGKWTPEIAKATADFFGGVTDPKDKQIIRSMMAGLLFHFFVSGVAYSTTFQKSGIQMTQDDPRAIEAVSTTAI